ncbi:sigma-70 family RNA polymerase sigma factor [Bacillus sp. JJ864]|uniref:sigma-70 family RNA polymerase sigma factor n=1 Tax=Bacillus sp. JJ864 TaxID=3122975 RepID=UPI002FFF2995
MLHSSDLYVEDYEQVPIQYAMNEKVEQKLDFESILSYLSAEYRLVIVLFYVNKFTTKEISGILSEKEGTIKSRLSRARQQLKTYYLQEEQILSNGRSSNES